MYKSYLDKLFLYSNRNQKLLPLCLRMEKKNYAYIGVLCTTGQTRNIFPEGRIYLSMQVRQFRGDSILYVSLNMVIWLLSRGDPAAIDDKRSIGPSKAWLHHPSLAHTPIHPLASTPKVSSLSFLPDDAMHVRTLTSEIKQQF